MSDNIKSKIKKKHQIAEKATLLMKETDVGRNILLPYLEYMLKNSINIDTYIYSFIRYFHESLDIEYGNEKNIEWNNFFKGKFDMQYEFYVENTEARFKKPILRYMKQFYKFLAKELEFDVFRKDERINLNFLERNDFIKLYPEGYRVVYFNKVDIPPENEKWLLDCNGYESTSTAIQYGQLIHLDFSNLKNPRFKDDLKVWVMKYERSLKSLSTEFSNIVQFLNLLESQELRRFKGNIIRINTGIDDGDITVNQVQLYSQYIKSDMLNYSQNTKNSKLWHVKSFLEYLKTRGYKISNEVFGFLKVRKPKGRNKDGLQVNSRQVIEKEEYRKIYKEIQRRAETETLYQLMWSFMYLLGHTEMRNSEILGLKRDCIINSMKPGEQLVRYTSKTTHGLKIKEKPFSSNVVRVIKKTIELTNDLAMGIKDEELRSYIFIKNTNGGSITSIKNDTFYRKFKKMVKLLPLDGNSYTLYDCRHTYMTTLFEESIRDGKTWKAILAIGHSDITTALKNYIKPSLKSYLEAMYKVSIGNVDIKGQVVYTLEDAIDKVPRNLNEIKVKNNCGFCKGNCNEDNIDCLLCVDFIATIDRIPYFKESIKLIDEQIQSESIKHEKEHLVTIKKLYVAYLAKLLSLAEDNN